MITQYITPYVDGVRHTYQFFAHSRELWVLTKENDKTSIRTEHQLGDAFESVLASIDKAATDAGWEKHQHAAN